MSPQVADSGSLPHGPRGGRPGLRPWSKVLAGAVCGGALGLLVSGCGTARSPARGGGPADRASDRISEQTFAELRAKNAGYVRRIEELENRVFILEDQLDSRKRATERRTAAPAVVTRSLGVNAASGRLGPAGAPEAPPLAEPGSAPESLVNEEVVEYVGDARGAPMAARSSSPSSRKLARRPQLRLWAGGAGAHLGARGQATARAATPQGQGFLAAAGGPGKREEEEGGGVGAPARLYRESLAALRAGQHEQAVAGFQRFLESYPQHVDAGNAEYWIAESHYDRAQFDVSEREFRAVIERYPDGHNVAEAMLKRGLSLYYLGDQARSRSVLQALTRAFPRREAAERARAQLAHPAELPPSKTATSSTPTSTTLPAAQARLASP
jgi:tol-pal system protein YbgF